MKKVIALALTLCLLLTLASCGCWHRTWLDASCLTPKTCAECGHTEGEALGHIWTEATCKTAKFCARCALVDGEALGHSWQDATTEAPKTCAACGETEGEKIVTDPRFTTKANQHLFGTWQGEITMPGAALIDELGFDAGSLVCIFDLQFHNDGTMNLNFSLKDEEGLRKIMVDYILDQAYQELAASGTSKEAGDQAMLQVYGKTMEEFVVDEVAKIDVNELIGAFSLDYFYYADGDLIYLGLSWDDMESDTYSMKDGVLCIPLDGEDISFTRIGD